MSNEEINNNEKNMDDNEKNKFTEQSNNKNIEPEVEQNKDIKVSQENVDKRPKRSKKGVALIIALLVATNTATAYMAPRVYSKVVTKVPRSEEHTSELQSRQYLVCRLLLEKKKPTLSHPPSRLTVH